MVKPIHFNGSKIIKYSLKCWKKLFTWIYNSVFGETMEKLRNNADVKLKKDTENIKN